MGESVIDDGGSSRDSVRLIRIRPLVIYLSYSRVIRDSGINLIRVPFSVSCVPDDRDRVLQGAQRTRTKQFAHSGSVGQLPTGEQRETRLLSISKKGNLFRHLPKFYPPNSYINSSLLLHEKNKSRSLCQFAWNDVK